MRTKRFHYLTLMGLLLGLFLAGPVQAKIDTSINWTSKNCFDIGPLQSCRPSDDWDTQRNPDFIPNYRWVYHKSGANPMVKVRFVENPVGKTLKDFSNDLEGRLRHQGMVDITSHGEKVNGQDAVIINAYSPSKNRRFLYGVFRGGNVGVYWECTTEPKDFQSYKNQFRTFISRTRVSGAS